MKNQNFIVSMTYVYEKKLNANFEPVVNFCNKKTGHNVRIISGAVDGT